MKTQSNLVTRFVDTEGNEIGNDIGILPITLYKGMNITIHSHSQTFSVVDWSYHHGHPDEGAGLRIVLK